MKLKIISLLSSLILIAGNLSATTPFSFANETLTYDVIYKWGLINKVAGYATMTLRNDGKFYRTAVYARNASWANRVYTLRDTLTSTITKGDFYPVSYTFAAHEKGNYKKDVLTFHRNGNTFSADAVRYKRKKNDETTKTSTIHLEAEGMTVDMLGSFFYLRSLDFDSMAEGESVSVNIFSGTKKENLKITYKGRRSVKINKNEYPAYYITFTFTHNGVESSDPISGWISTASQRIPLKIKGSLAVGAVQAIYTGQVF